MPAGDNWIILRSDRDRSNSSNFFLAYVLSLCNQLPAPTFGLFISFACKCISDAVRVVFCTDKDFHLSDYCIPLSAMFIFSSVQISLCNAVPQLLYICYACQF